MASSHEVSHHILPIKSSLKILGVLLVLTVITVGIATPVSGVDFGIFNTFIAMAVATAKASLVLLYFMGLKYDDKLYLVLFLSGIFFLILLWAFCILDIYSRLGVSSALDI